MTSNTTIYLCTTHTHTLSSLKQGLLGWQIGHNYLKTEYEYAGAQFVSGFFWYLPKWQKQYIQGEINLLLLNKWDLFKALNFSKHGVQK